MEDQSFTTDPDDESFLDEQKAMNRTLLQLSRCREMFTNTHDGGEEYLRLVPLLSETENTVEKRRKMILEGDWQGIRHLEADWNRLRAR